MKTWKQILSLLLIAALFVSFDLSVYLLFTRRCTRRFAAGAIEPAAYLPFGEDSGIVKIEAEKLTGELPVLDGAAALLPVYSAVFHALYPEEAFAFDGECYAPESKMQYRNTRGAYEALVDGDADLIFCAAPSRQQLEYAALKGVELELTPIGLEAFVFFVNEHNPVSGLTQEQLRDIYAGALTNWKEVGGPDRLICALQRNPGSGSQSRFLAFMEGRPTGHEPFAFLGASVGFSFRYYVDGIVKADGVKLLAVDGVYPGREEIRAGSYPLAGPFYAVSRKGDPNPNLSRILEFVLSPQGQRIVEESGYVSVNGTGAGGGE